MNATDLTEKPKDIQISKEGWLNLLKGALAPNAVADESSRRKGFEFNLDIRKMCERRSKEQSKFEDFVKRTFELSTWITNSLKKHPEGKFFREFLSQVRVQAYEEQIQAFKALASSIKQSGDGDSYPLRRFLASVISWYLSYNPKVLPSLARINYKIHEIEKKTRYSPSIRKKQFPSRNAIIGLNCIFSFYGKKINSPQATFDHIKQKSCSLNITNFMNFCKDFGIRNRLSVNDIDKVFKANAQICRDMDFIGFLQALKTLASLFYTEDMSEFEKEYEFYAFLECENQEKYRNKMEKHRISQSIPRSPMKSARVRQQIQEWKSRKKSQETELPKISADRTPNISFKLAKANKYSDVLKYKADAKKVKSMGDGKFVNWQILTDMSPKLFLGSKINSLFGINKSDK